MDRQAYYSQPYATVSTHRYPSTSSAFSASANPNEDWTKITDLAERRRIQNRIAQRNYRKKLKKRLEDLEKRAASNSASPEQTPAELDVPNPQKKNSQSSDRRSSQSSSNYSSFDSQSSQAPPMHFMSFDERGMFDQQYTRQMTTSPPPFAYSGYPSDAMSFQPFSQDMPYTGLSSSECPIFPTELPPLSSSIPTTLPMITATDYPMKPDQYLHAEVTQYNLSYPPPMGSIDISAAQSYTESNPHTPPLSECLDLSVAGSPPELSMPNTPPFIASL